MAARSTPSKGASSSAAPSCSGSATASASFDHRARSRRWRYRFPINGDVYLVPAFAGLGAPHWDQYARGTIVGLTRGSTAGHIARAALESIAFQSADLLDAMQADAGTRLAELRVDGGAARNDLLMQFQSDLIGAPVVRPQDHRDDGPGRSLSGGAGNRVLEERRGNRQPMANGAPLRADDAGGAGPRIALTLDRSARTGKRVGAVMTGGCTRSRHP